LSLGDLDPGQFVNITFDVTVDTTIPANVTQVCNQGLFSGDNFANLLTDDFDTGTAGDATCTEVPLQFGTIQIIKNTVPDDAQDFAFTAAGGLNPSTFDLDDDADGTLPNTQTYSNVSPGSYSVTESAVVGYITPLSCVAPDGGSSTTAHTATIDLAAGETVTCTFNNLKSSTLSGSKFEDLDADGYPREGGEPGLPGWTIYVDYDDDGTLDPGEPFSVTDSNGDYYLINILPGTYKVRVAQNGWTCSYPNAGDSIPGTVPIESDVCWHNETFSGDQMAGDDFGNWTTATKSGVKFEDLDADGAAREVGEPGLPGWTIYVDYDDDGILDAGEPFGVTDGSGYYFLIHILPGTYKVREVVQNGWTCSYPNDGSNDADSWGVITSTAC